MASVLASYAMQNARAEALSIAASPEIEHGFSSRGFSGVVSEFQHHEQTLQGGFALALQGGDEEASFNAPAPWPIMKARLPLADATAGRPAQFTWQQTDYTLGSAPVPGGGLILWRFRCPASFLKLFAKSRLASSATTIWPVTGDWCAAPTWGCCCCSP